MIVRSPVPPCSAGLPRPILLHDMGVGAAIADALERACPPLRRLALPIPAEYGGLVTPGALVLLAGGGPLRSLEAALDDMVRRRRGTIIPVVAEALNIRIGPVLGPADPATVRCYYARREQHAPSDVPLRRIHDHLDDRAAAGHPAPAPGFLASTLTLVALIVADLITGVRAGTSGRRVVLVDPLSGAVVPTTLLGVDGNARHRPSAIRSDRTWRRLRDAVAAGARES